MKRTIKVTTVREWDIEIDDKNTQLCGKNCGMYERPLGIFVCRAFERQLMNYSIDDEDGGCTTTDRLKRCNECFEEAGECVHKWESNGGRGCHKGNTNCSQTVYVCSVCGEEDYGYPDGPAYEECYIKCDWELQEEWR